MKDQLITFETAVLAKEKGFDWIDDNTICGGYVKSDKKIDPIKLKKDWGKYIVYTPTQSLFQKWLREKYGIHVEITWIDTLSFLYVFKIITTGNPPRKQSKLYQGYEEALEKGLIEALKLIKP